MKKKNNVGIKIKYNGKEYKSIRALAKEYGIGTGTLRLRIKSGWDLDKALTKVPKTQEELFWSKVNRQTESGCWEWTKPPTRSGYGRFCAGFKSFRETLAHRISWTLYNGPIPDELCCLHKCDNRLCCNPEHLFLGTRKDNMDDKVNKSRQSKGEEIYSAKLTAKQVKEIKARLLHGELPKDICIDYNVLRRTIQNIINGKSWKHIEVEAVDIDYAEPIKYNIRGHNKRYSIEQLSKMEINDIKDLKQQQINLQKIANQYNCTKRLISSV